MKVTSKGKPNVINCPKVSPEMGEILTLEKLEIQYFTYIHMYVQIYTFIIFICAYIYIHIYVYVHLYIYIHLSLSLYIYILYIHICTQTHLSVSLSLSLSLRCSLREFNIYAHISFGGVISRIYHGCTTLKQFLN